jgi:hypothetical protein
VPHNSIAQLVDSNSSNQHYLQQQQQLQQRLQHSALQPTWHESDEVAHVQQQHEIDQSDVQLLEEPHDEDENFF